MSESTSLFFSWLVLLGPFLATGYALQTAVFQYAWYEAPGWTNAMAYWRKEGQAILLRLGLVYVSSKTEIFVNLIPLDDDKWKKILLQGVLVVMISVASWMALVQTRVWTVQGGPGPTTSLQSNDDNSRVILITGANTGIGKETARQLLQDAAAASTSLTVILACRSVEKAEAARLEVLQGLEGNSRLSCWVLPLDLCSYDSIRQAVPLVAQRHPQGLDTLILNAGLMHKDYAITQDKHERVLQANHLGHYLLLRLLLPHLTKQPSRVLILTSSTYALCPKLPLDDLQCKTRSYTLFSQYAVSKLCNILTAAELARRYPGIWTAAIHPGLVRTQVVRNMPWLLRTGDSMFGWILKSMQKTPAQGAWGTVHLAQQSSIQSLQSGEYWVNRRIQPRLPQACDAQAARKLWDLSAQLVGLEEEETKKRV